MKSTCFGENTPTVPPSSLRATPISARTASLQHTGNTSRKTILISFPKQYKYQITFFSSNCTSLYESVSFQSNFRTSSSKKNSHDNNIFSVVHSQSSMHRRVPNSCGKTNYLGIWTTSFQHTHALRKIMVIGFQNSGSLN